MKLADSGACACGCGKPLPPKKPGRPPARYLQYHVNRAAIAAAKLGHLNPNWRGDAISYQGMHTRLQRQRVEGACVDCGGVGREWSLKAGISADRLKTDDHGSPYTSDLGDYEPRCTPCHRRLDAKPKRACKRGHPLTDDNVLVGKYARRCRICTTAWQAHYAERP